MKPSIWVYGGVHDDPGSRQKFVEELAKQEAPPHFVAVEWEESVFDQIVKWRPWIENELRSCWDFLSPSDCRELSLALAWEGDAYAGQFPNVDRLWLETGFQEADLKRRYGAHAEGFPKSLAWGLLGRLRTPCGHTMREFWSSADAPPTPTTKKELIDRLSKKAWSELLPPTPADFERDKRWAAAISDRGSDISGGWVAIVVGWAHADPAGDSGRLRSLLSSKDFRVIPVCLAP